MDSEWKFTAARYADRIYPGRYPDDPESVGRDPYTEDGFQIQQGRNRNKNQGQGAANSGNNSSQKGLDRRNSAPDVLQQQQPQHPPRKPLSQAERVQNGVCPNYPRNCRFGDLWKFQHVVSKVPNGKPKGQNVRSVNVKDNSDFDQKLDQITAVLTLVQRS